MVTRSMLDPYTTICPLPERPWHPDASLADAKSIIATWRAHTPACAKTKDDVPNYCAMCLREVVPWKLPEARTPSVTVAPALGATPAVADGVRRRKWQR